MKLHIADQNPSSHRRIAIIGAGPGGLCAGVKLLDAGIDDFVIIERSAGVGGTWYNTRYPGLACDIKSSVYSFTFEPNPNWTTAYAKQPEILNYLEHVAEKYGLLRHVILNTDITGIQWEEANSRWLLQSADGTLMTADVVVAAQGMFNELSWPDIAGLEEFGGNLFHAARWPEKFEPSGSRIAVIGSAASAVQFVPVIAPLARQLYLFQRSAPWVLPKDDELVAPAIREALAEDSLLLRQQRDRIFAEIEGRITYERPADRAWCTAAGLRNLEVVQDEELRRKLTPTVPFGCLRPLISNEYYPTFNRENVELVDDPIACVTPQGIESRDGTLREVDTIVCATGYQVRKYLTAIPVIGRSGLTLAEAWKDHPEAYLGIMTAGFPNLFMMYGPNTNSGSILYMLEQQADFIVAQLRSMERKRLAWIDIRRDVMDEYNRRLQRDLAEVAVWQASCSNYYRVPSGRIVTQWPHTMTEYADRCMQVEDSYFEAGRLETFAEP